MTTIRELIDMLQSEVDAADGRDDFEIRLCNQGPDLNPTDDQGSIAADVWTNRGGYTEPREVGNDRHPRTIQPDDHIVYIDFDTDPEHD